ncbi:MAG: tetratricopeptide repeat protein, partial [Gammaproteobacteria bacterium]|nr:tetratricopeptide repeat protein [Gammaproteobacteria bacterium]
ALSALGRNEDAMTVLEQAVDIEPDNTSLRLALAKSLRENGALKRARSEIYKGLALDPEHEE